MIFTVGKEWDKGIARDKVEERKKIVEVMLMS